MSVCAFVLTRDRKELLAECIRALLAQTHPLDLVLVLDNASSDGTEQHLRAEGLLDSGRVRFERREENTGGAGGYDAGLQLAAASGHDWIWLMDDDAEPRPDALERLLRSPPAQDAATAGVCTAVINLDGTIDTLHRCHHGRFIVPLGPEAYERGRYPAVDCASFVGLMLRADVVREVGRVRTEFFLGYDDAEYSLRVRRQGPIHLVPEAEVLHKIPIGDTRPTRRSRFWNRVIGGGYASAPWETYWRDLYRVRNFMALKHEHARPGRLHFALLTSGYVVKTLMYDERPLRRVAWVVRFALKGRRGDFSAPTPAEWRRLAAGS